MNKWNTIIYFGCLVLTGSVAAAQVSIDEDYMQVMEDRQKSLTSNLALMNGKGATEDVGQLKDMFSDVELFYQQKGNAPDAVDWSKQSKGYAVAITQYVAAKDFDNAALTSVKMAKTCKECHGVYKKDK